MKNIQQYLILLFLIVFLANPVLGFQGMSVNNTTELPDLTNVTESDADIELLQHLIEVDAVQLQSQNKLFVRETIIFKNQGIMNFMGFLRTWVPDGAEIVWQKEDGEIVFQNMIQRRNMMDGTLDNTFQPIRNGNIVSWNDFIAAGSLPPLYVVTYLVPAEAEGTLTKTLVYTKKLAYPTLINYRYEGRSGLPAIVLKTTKPADWSVSLNDENKNKISSTEVSEEGNSMIYRFGTPEFKEISIEISKAAVTPAGIAGYVIFGLLIILVFSYPIIRKKSERLQSMEEKIRNSLKRKTEEKSEAEELIEETPEGTRPLEDAEFAGKTGEELETIKNETISKLEELQKEYSSGNLLDEEYEELRKPHQEKLDRIRKKLEQIG